MRTRALLPCLPGMASLDDMMVLVGVLLRVSEWNVYSL